MLAAAKETTINLSLQTRITAVVLALAFAILILELIRRRKLQERYTVLWLSASVLMVLGAAVPSSLKMMTRLLGMTDANAALFSILILGLLGLVLHLTVVVSGQSEQITRLAQEQACGQVSFSERRESGQSPIGPATPSAPAPGDGNAFPPDRD